MIPERVITQTELKRNNSRPFQPDIRLAFEDVMQSRPVERGERKHK